MAVICSRKKDLWSYGKVRYRGIEENAAQVLTLFALTNLTLCRRDLQALQGLCASFSEIEMKNETTTRKQSKIKSGRT